MKRYELVEKLWNELLDDHKKKFGWAGETDYPKYSLGEFPADFDHDGWAKKVKRLEKVMDFLNHLESVMKKLEEIDAPTAVWVGFEPADKEGYNVTARIEKARFVYKWGYHYRDRAAHLYPIEVTEPIPEDELRKKQREAIAHLNNWDSLDLMKGVIEQELEEARSHLAWLEEEVGDE